MHWFILLLLPFVTFANINCPVGYAPVAPNPELGVNEPFCVMIYEARAFDESTKSVNLLGCKEASCTTANWATPFNSASSPSGVKPVSVADGLPWRMIDQDRARLACQGLGAGYQLITNAQWMTIANDIEGVASNWSSGKVSDGQLNRGHSDNNPPNPCDSRLENVQDSCSSPGKEFSQKRTHTLSNGTILWDIAGNLWNWTDWNVPMDKKAYYSKDGTSLEDWREMDQIDRNIAAGMPMESKLWRSLKYPQHNSAQSVGRYWSGDNNIGGAAIRGSRWKHGDSAGIYTLDLNSARHITSANVTFRCTYTGQ